MGGTLAADSVVGTGSTFHFSVALEPVRRTGLLRSLRDAVTPDGLPSGPAAPLAAGGPEEPAVLAAPSAPSLRWIGGHRGCQARRPWPTSSPS